MFAFLGTIHIIKIYVYALTFMHMLSIRVRNLCTRSAHASVTYACTWHPSKELMPSLSLCMRYLNFLAPSLNFALFHG
jgi:hypothetical protein